MYMFLIFFHLVNNTYLITKLDTMSQMDNNKDVRTYILFNIFL